MVGEASPIVTHLGEVSLVHRSRGHPTVANDVGRGTLTDSALGAAIHENGKVRVGVDVNEPRRDKATTDINDLPSLERADRGNLSNPTSSDGKVTPEPGTPTSV